MYKAWKVCEGIILKAPGRRIQIKGMLWGISKHSMDQSIKR